MNACLVGWECIFFVKDMIESTKVKVKMKMKMKRINVEIFSIVKMSPHMLLSRN